VVVCSLKRPLALLRLTCQVCNKYLKIVRLKPFVNLGHKKYNKIHKNFEKIVMKNFLSLSQNCYKN
jgi:hypothetical protein